MFRRALSALSVLVVLIFSASCGDATGPDSIAGAYHLETVGGHTLPYVNYDDGQFKNETLSEVITLSANKTFSYTFRNRATNAGVSHEETDTFTGTWSLNGDKLTLVIPQEEFTIVGTLSGKTLTLSDADSGLTAVYRKS